MTRVRAAAEELAGTGGIPRSCGGVGREGQAARIRTWTFPLEEQPKAVVGAAGVAGLEIADSLVPESECERIHEPGLGREERPAPDRPREG